MKEPLGRIREDNTRLQASIDAISTYLDELDASTTTPQTEHAPSTATDPATRVERLVGAYRDLKREHEELMNRYAAEYEKWRRWKQWARGTPGTSRRARKEKGVEKQKENVADAVLDEDLNDITLVETEGPLASTSEWPHTPQKQPLTPSRRDANSPGSPSTSSTLMNNALKAAASKLDMRKAKVAHSPTSKNSPAPKFSTEPRNLKRKGAEDGTPMMTKGKGRYAQPQSERPERPHSLSKAVKKNASFKYEEVVRNKRERRLLHGGDCECCRDYYAAVGPLPPRPQPPLWRTPPSSPSKHGRMGNSKLTFDDAEDLDDDFDADIAAHKKQISRHRHRWEAPKTPPGYWDISFPDTQEVDEINRRADAMHARKKARTEPEPHASSSRKQKRK